MPLLSRRLSATAEPFVPLGTGAFADIRNQTYAVNSYMLRYLKAVQMMKQIIEESNLTVMATIARYACAYEAIAKPDWWDKSKR